jgi:hypothetical protein
MLSHNILSASPRRRAVRCKGLDLLGSQTVGSNPAYGIDVCPRLFIVIIITIHLSLYYRDYMV